EHIVAIISKKQNFRVCCFHISTVDTHSWPKTTTQHNTNIWYFRRTPHRHLFSPIQYFSPNSHYSYANSL
ncbi:hypothetical protein QVD17_34362, partial [Tagetes erecta]